LERDAVDAAASGATISQGGSLRERSSSAQDDGADPPSLKLRRDWYQACRAVFSKASRTAKSCGPGIRCWCQVSRRFWRPNRAREAFQSAGRWWQKGTRHQGEREGNR